MTFMACSSMSLRAVREARRAADASSSTSMEATDSDDRFSSAVDRRDLHSSRHKETRRRAFQAVCVAMLSVQALTTACNALYHLLNPPTTNHTPSSAHSSHSSSPLHNPACLQEHLKQHAYPHPLSHLKRVVKAVTRWCMTLIDTVSDRRRQASE